MPPGRGRLNDAHENGPDDAATLERWPQLRSPGWTTSRWSYENCSRSIRTWNGLLGKAATLSWTWTGCAALIHGERLVRLNPTRPAAFQVAFLYFHDKRYKEAVDEARESLADAG